MSCYNLGVLYFEKGELDRALINYEKALEINSFFDLAHAGIGKILAKQGKNKESLIELQKGNGVISFDVDDHFSAI